MRRRNVDVLATYTHELAGWLTLRDRFSYNHSNLDYSCVEKVSYRTSDEPIYDWYYKDSRTGNIKYIEVDSVRSGSPLCFNPDHRITSNMLDFTGKFETGNVKHNYTLGWTYSYFNFTQYNGYGDGDVWGPGLNEMVSVANPHYVRDWWDSKVSAASISHYTTNAIYLTDVLILTNTGKVCLAVVSIPIDTKRQQQQSVTDVSIMMMPIVQTGRKFQLLLLPTVPDWCICRFQKSRFMLLPLLSSNHIIPCIIKM